MKCSVCGKGPMHGVAVYRTNPKGEIGIWACREHLLRTADPVTQEIVNLIEERNQEKGKH